MLTFEGLTKAQQEALEETSSDGSCCSCGEFLMMRVLHSNAGFFIGTQCLDEGCESYGPDLFSMYGTQAECNRWLQSGFFPPKS